MIVEIRILEKACTRINRRSKARQSKLPGEFAAVHEPPPLINHPLQITGCGDLRVGRMKLSDGEM
jgi:hypothetical protein